MRIEPGVRPLIIISQDEAIFKQYLFRVKRWQIGKTRAAMPKDDGAGVMISGFQSREFGFGLEMSVDDLRTSSRPSRSDCIFYLVQMYTFHYFEGQVIFALSKVFNASVDMTQGRMKDGSHRDIAQKLYAARSMAPRIENP